MKHYAFSSKFPTPFETKGKDVVVQYELKLEEGLTCGGNYTFFHVILVCHLHNGCVSLLQLFLLKVFHRYYLAKKLIYLYNVYFYCDLEYPKV